MSRDNLCLKKEKKKILLYTNSSAQAARILNSICLAFWFCWVWTFPFPIRSVIIYYMSLDALPRTGSTPLGDQKPQLHVSAQEFYLIQEEVHVLPAHLRADHHLAEEVDLSPVGLVAQHEASLLHHPLLNGWGHLQGERREEVRDQNTKAFQLHFH